MNHYQFSLVLLISTLLLLPSNTIFGQIRIPVPGQLDLDHVNNSLKQFKIKDAYSFNIGEFYFHQLYGNGVVGLYETADLSLIIEGQMERKDNGSYVSDFKYHAVPKQASRPSDNVDFAPANLTLNANLNRGTVAGRAERRAANRTVISPSRRLRSPTADSGYYGPLGAGLTGYWKSNGNVSNYIDMKTSDKSIYWLSESQRPGREQSFVFIGKFREITSPPDEFGYRSSKYYRVTGSYYSLNKFNQTAKYFGQATYEGDWFMLKQKSATGTNFGKSKLPKTLHKQRMGVLSVSRIEALSKDACGEMNFKGNISSNSGLDELRVGESNVINFSRGNHWKHRYRWVADKSTIYHLKITLKDWDQSHLCGGGDDYVDINPERGRPDDLADVYLELMVTVDGFIHQKIGRTRVQLGRIGENITIQGDCGNSGLECAKITFRVDHDDL